MVRILSELSQDEKIELMSRSDWLVGGDRRTAAAERIYDAAMDLIARDGLDAFDVDTLASRVHCSRATIYRHVGGKAEIRDAVLVRAAARIVDDGARAVDGLSGAERIVTAITVALRGDSIRSAWSVDDQLDSQCAGDDVAHRISDRGRVRDRSQRAHRGRHRGCAMDRAHRDVVAVLARRRCRRRAQMVERFVSPAFAA